METIIRAFLVAAFLACPASAAIVSMGQSGLTVTTADDRYVNSPTESVAQTMTASMTVTGAGGIESTYGIKSATLNVTGVTTANGIYNTGTSTATRYYGDGSNLTGIASGTLSGLTTNTIPKATAANALGNSLLTDNATTLAYSGSGFTVGVSTLVVAAGKVGVGKAAPASALSVYPNGANFNAITPETYTSIYTDAGNQNNAIQILSGNTSVGIIAFGDDGDGDIGRVRYNHSDNSMQFFTNAAVKMAITSAGDVGIGTTAPSTKLDVAGGQVAISSSTTSTANMKFIGALTKAALLAYDPVTAGESGYCTDCSASTLCVSTGTAVSQIADIGDRTAACQ